ncbi:HAD family hydrolase [bacterium]|nr:HAD family hydrolase [bacterium]
MTLVLFDIDGTLLLSGAAGVHAFERAAHSLFGQGGGDIDFAGRLDGENARMWIEGAGGVVSKKNESIFKRKVLLEMPRALVASKGKVLPGVRILIKRLEVLGISFGLLTGNWERTGQMKLNHFGLKGAFTWGAWADDGETREELFPVAIARAKRSGWDGHGPIWVVGDTYRDVEVAKAHGAHSLGVLTGPPYAHSRLVESNPDVILENLSETDKVLDILEIC